VNTIYSISERAAILLATIACSVLAAMAISETDVGLVIGVPIAIIANVALFAIYIRHLRRLHATEPALATSAEPASGGPDDDPPAVSSVRVHTVVPGCASVRENIDIYVSDPDFWYQDDTGVKRVDVDGQVWTFRARGVARAIDAQPPRISGPVRRRGRDSHPLRDPVDISDAYRQAS